MPFPGSHITISQENVPVSEKNRPVSPASRTESFLRYTLISGTAKLEMNRCKTCDNILALKGDTNRRQKIIFYVGNNRVLILRKK